MSNAAVASLEKRLATVTARLAEVEKQLASGGGAPSSSVTSGGSSGASSGWVAEYEELVRTYIDKYVELSAGIDPLVKTQAGVVKEAFDCQVAFLKVASQCKKPSDPAVFQALLAPTSKKMQEVAAIRDKARGHEFFTWLSTVSEGINALGWVCIEPTPGPAVNDTRGSSEFYSNKLLVKYKNDPSGKNNVEWVKAFNGFLKELFTYIKKSHTTGLSWNPRGKVASASDLGSAASSSAPAPAKAKPVVSKASAAANLFSEINKVRDRQTGGRTEGLRKVQAHEKSKNRTDRSGVVKAVPKKTVTRKYGGSTSTKPAKFALEGNKWVIEYQNDNKSLVIDQTQTKQTVYVYKCVGSVIQVKGKVNAITFDNCKKCGLVFENAISACEIVNSQSVQVQVTGAVPNITIDKTDGCQVFLSKDSLNVEIISAKSSEMNVLLPNPNGGDMIEIPIAEQFKTVVTPDKKNITTTTVSHLG